MSEKRSWSVLVASKNFGIHIEEYTGTFIKEPSKNRKNEINKGKFPKKERMDY